MPLARGLAKIEGARTAMAIRHLPVIGHLTSAPVPLRKVAIEEAPADWLTAAEVDSWLSVVRLMTWLPWSIDQQLQRDSNLGMVEYQVLAMLSNRPERTMRMSSLAEVTNASLSRLSHLVKRLEGRGLVRREPDPADGRFTNAILTDEGLPDTRRCRARARGPCAVARHRRPVARAATAPRPDRGPHHVAHRHLWNQLELRIQRIAGPRPACISQIRTSLGSAAARRRSPAAVRRAASPASSKPSASRSIRPRVT